VDLRVQEHWIRNKKGKTVVGLIAESGRASPPDSEELHKLPTALHIQAVRGHPTYFGRVVRFLRSDTRACAVKTPDLDRVLAAIGRTPEDYAKWIEILLDPHCRADAAMKEILAALLRTIQVNEGGVRADLDSEFLHDLRVALRRTRSGLRRVKGIFLQKWADRFQDDFKWLAGTTNALRDLDVLLIKLDDYEMGLSLTDRKNLKPLREFVLEKRSAALAEVRETLESERYEEVIRRWQKFLVKPVPKAPKAPHATDPIGQVASKEIWFALQRVLKRGMAVEPEPTSETLHRLRIACKRLRYLLTFFRSLYPEEEMERLLLPLKELQDTLGTFNDLVIHRKEMAEYATLLGDQRGVRKKTLRAMARLTKEMTVRQEAELESFSLRFASFTSPGSQAIYRRLFAPDEEEA
jgi:CHAD domain-containing protein